ncbi:hypothetical protein AK812_SmicGene8064 [Symbiodinium microadriaticum]|uniref:Uncharacterized protein n=1 Tax=Symbiodinium microadriaticum TaxID=2951 RepID=A0A1Q9ELS4_SYMMI|nr:hypothetical protein AK812_SmicGene8064 [Symbiodinium microadriaticum]
MILVATMAVMTVILLMVAMMTANADDDGGDDDDDDDDGDDDYGDADDDHGVDSDDDDDGDDDGDDDDGDGGDTDADCDDTDGTVMVLVLLISGSSGAVYRVTMKAGTWQALLMFLREPDLVMVRLGGLGLGTVELLLPEDQLRDWARAELQEVRAVAVLAAEADQAADAVEVLRSMGFKRVANLRTKVDECGTGKEVPTREKCFKPRSVLLRCWPPAGAMGNASGHLDICAQECQQRAHEYLRQSQVHMEKVLDDERQSTGRAPQGAFASTLLVILGV